MNGFKLNFLQWTYPMVLWMLVAFFTLLACKNVVGNNWIPAQSGSSLSKVRVFETVLFADHGNMGGGVVLVSR